MLIIIFSIFSLLLLGQGTKKGLQNGYSPFHNPHIQNTFYTILLLPYHQQVLEYNCMLVDQLYHLHQQL